MALGSLSLNLALPASFTASLAPIISSLVPKTTSLNLSIPKLNDIKAKMAPRNRDENLESGALQLSTGTAVLVDMRGIGEGKLEDAGELTPGSRDRVRELIISVKLRCSQLEAYCHYHGSAEALLRVSLLVLRA